MQAANDTNSPVIIQASRGALKYSKMIYLKKLMEAATEEFPQIPVSMHLDHGNSLETCKEAIALGFTSVMMERLVVGKTAKPPTPTSRMWILPASGGYAIPLASPWKANWLLGRH